MFPTTELSSNGQVRVRMGSWDPNSYTLVTFDDITPVVIPKLDMGQAIQHASLARSTDPFIKAYILDETRWSRGEWSYDKNRFVFHPVGKAAVPPVILMAVLITT